MLPLSWLIIKNPQPNLCSGETSIQRTVSLPHKQKFHCKWIADALHE